MEKTAAEQSLKREYESRDGLEKLLQGYKDEVDTLKEALNIAAEAVAEANMRDDAFASQEQQQVALVPEENSEEASYYHYGYEDQADGEYDYGGYAYTAHQEEFAGGAAIFEELPPAFEEQREAEGTEKAHSEALLQELESHGEEDFEEDFEDANEQ